MEQDNIDDKRETSKNLKKKSPNSRSPCGGVWAKLKSIKHIEIIAIVVVVAIVALLFGVSSGKVKQDIATVSETDKLASEMQTILSNIKGVGNVKVLIVFSGGNKIEIASKIDKESNTVNDEGRVTTIETETSTPVMVNGKPFVLNELRASIDGVVVVADGGANADIRMKIIRAVATLLQVNFSKVQVFEKG